MSTSLGYYLWKRKRLVLCIDHIKRVCNYTAIVQHVLHVTTCAIQDMQPQVPATLLAIKLPPRCVHSAVWVEMIRTRRTTITCSDVNGRSRLHKIHLHKISLEARPNALIQVLMSSDVEVHLHHAHCTLVSHGKVAQ